MHSREREMNKQRGMKVQCLGSSEMFRTATAQAMQGTMPGWKQAVKGSAP